jgi:hypothetical protein
MNGMLLHQLTQKSVNAGKLESTPPVENPMSSVATVAKSVAVANLKEKRPLPKVDAASADAIVSVGNAVLMVAAVALSVKEGGTKSSLAKMDAAAAVAAAEPRESSSVSAPALGAMRPATIDSIGVATG